jgi:hypothetical protein
LKKLAQYTSVLLLLLFFLCGSGCSVKYLNLNDIPEVITRAENMSEDDAVTKLRHILFVCKTNNQGTYTVASYGIRYTTYYEAIGREVAVLRHPTSYHPGASLHELETRELCKSLSFSDIGKVKTFDKVYGNFDHKVRLVALYKAGFNPARLIFPEALVNYPYIGIIIDDCYLNDFLAALYVLCPKLH